MLAALVLAVAALLTSPLSPQRMPPAAPKGGVRLASTAATGAGRTPTGAAPTPCNPAELDGAQACTALYAYLY